MWGFVLDADEIGGLVDDRDLKLISDQETFGTNRDQERTFFHCTHIEQIEMGGSSVLAGFLDGLKDHLLDDFRKLSFIQHAPLLSFIALDVGDGLGDDIGALLEDPILAPFETLGRERDIECHSGSDERLARIVRVHITSEISSVAAGVVQF